MAKRNYQNHNRLGVKMPGIEPQVATPAEARAIHLFLDDCEKAFKEALENFSTVQLDEFGYVERIEKHYETCLSAVRFMRAHAPHRPDDK